MIDWMVFAERIRAELERQEMSYTQLADKMGVTTATVSRYASGKRIPTAATILKAADVLGVTCDYLFGLSDDPHGTSVQPSFSRDHENDRSAEPCEDAVNRADVVDMLEMYPFTEYNEYEAAREVVKRLPSVTPKAEQRWIPCSEKLPEDDVEVFVYLFDRPSPYIAWFREGCWFTEEFQVEKENYPKAWMPLPEPYREEGGTDD